MCNASLFGGLRFIEKWALACLCRQTGSTLRFDGLKPDF
jgi:hypothetical protein